MTASEKIESKVAFEPNSGCWLWLGAVDKDGYGTVNINRWPYRAHRVSYEANVGRIPDGLEIDHKCSVRSCVNPAHLEPVTRAENWRRSRAPMLIEQNLGCSRGTHNKKKMSCQRGHPYNPENTFGRSGRPSRECRICKRARDRAAYAKKNGAKNV